MQDVLLTAGLRSLMPVYQGRRATVKYKGPLPSLEPRKSTCTSVMGRTGKTAPIFPSYVAVSAGRWT